MKLPLWAFLFDTKKPIYIDKFVKKISDIDESNLIISKIKTEQVLVSLDEFKNMKGSDFKNINFIYIALGAKEKGFSDFILGLISVFVNRKKVEIRLNKLGFNTKFFSIDYNWVNAKYLYQNPIQAKEIVKRLASIGLKELFFKTWLGIKIKLRSNILSQAGVVYGKKDYR